MTVVVPVRDDPEGVAVALAGLAEQSPAPDEVVLVNAGGPLDVSGALRPQPRLVPAPSALPGAARNRGAAAAAHPWLAFLDAGTRPVPGWLEAFARVRATRPEARVVYGTYDPVLRDEWDWAAAASYLSPAESPGRGRHPTSASLLVERATWDALGGMPPGLRAGEDLLFFREVAARGIPTAVAEEAKVLWQLPRGPLGHLRRLRRYSRATWPTSLAATWQRPVLRMWAAAAAIAAAALAFHPGLAAAIPAAAGWRVARNYRRRRSGLEGRLTLPRLCRILAMTLLADLGTLLGVCDATLAAGRPPGTGE